VLPPLHAVTDDGLLATPDFPHQARAVLRAGAARIALHLRGPGLNGRALFELADVLVPAATDAGALLIVNERVDVALACGAHGVQLGRAAISLPDARRLLGRTRPIGASVHSEAEAREAVAGEADYLLVGTLYATPSHPARRAAGPGLLRRLRPLGVPLLGIGGVTAGRLPKLRATGASGVAVIRAIWHTDDPAAAVRRLLESWDRWEE
jgi:thiamine-phosphate pyrophosphorylase